MYALLALRRLLLVALAALAAALAGCSSIEEKNVKVTSLASLEGVERIATERAIDQAVERCVTIRPSPATVGSGAIVSDDGWILTAEHVIRGQRTVEVILAGGKSCVGRVIAKSQGNDYALVKIDAKGLPFFKLGKRPALGERVIAVGTPTKWVTPNASTGVVIYPKVRIPGEEGAYYYEAIFHSAPIFPGDSGGPLVDLHGNLVGIHGGFASENASVAPAIAEIVKRLPNNGQLAGASFVSDEETYPIPWPAQKPKDFAESAEWTARSVEETLAVVYAGDRVGVHDVLERAKARYVALRATDRRRDDELVRAMLGDVFKELEARQKGRPQTAAATGPEVQTVGKPRRRRIREARRDRRRAPASSPRAARSRFPIS
jgi:hypothetical protein